MKKKTLKKLQPQKKILLDPLTHTVPSFGNEKKKKEEKK